MNDESATQFTTNSGGTEIILVSPGCQHQQAVSQTLARCSSGHGMNTWTKGLAKGWESAKMLSTTPKTDPLKD
jgi:hypothetical protein